MLKKKIIGILTLTILILFAMVTYVIYQLETSIDDVLSEEQQEYLFKRIEDTEELPENFYSVTELYFDGIYKTTFWKTVLRKLIQNEFATCSCHRIYMPYVPGERIKTPEKFPFGISGDYKKYVITLELEKRFSQKECYKFHMNNAYFGKNAIGIKQASSRIFGKEISELSEDEILKLNLIQNGPGRYSNKAVLERALNRLKSSRN